LEIVKVEFLIEVVPLGVQVELCVAVRFADVQSTVSDRVKYLYDELEKSF